MITQYKPKLKWVKGFCNDSFCDYTPHTIIFDAGKGVGISVTHNIDQRYYSWSLFDASKGGPEGIIQSSADNVIKYGKQGEIKTYEEAIEQAEKTYFGYMPKTELRWFSNCDCDRYLASIDGLHIAVCSVWLHSDGAWVWRAKSDISSKSGFEDTRESAIAVCEKAGIVLASRGEGKQ